MNCWQVFVISFVLIQVHCAVIPDDNGDTNEGLYNDSDHVIVLTKRNFERKIYGQKHAFLVQFYNSFCGHCRAFAPKFKSFAAEVESWKNIVRLATIDCSTEENNGICRDFAVTSYPSLRYLHENYAKGNANIGEEMPLGNVQKLKAILATKLQTEQSLGRLTFAPSLSIASYSSYAMALNNIPNNAIYTFLIFENESSTVGSEIALDINNYEHIYVKRVYETSELAQLAGVTTLPGLVAVRYTLEPTLLTPNEPTEKNLLKAINIFLESKNYKFPVRNPTQDINPSELSAEKPAGLNSDAIYYVDLEKTIKATLHTEITKYKKLSNENVQALQDYLNALITNFPARNNLKAYLVDLRDNISTRSEWGGSDLYDLVKRLETVHEPVYSPDLEYVACKGSEQQYRGYTCGLWTLFHTLTVNAAHKPGTEGAKVLKAMYGFVSNFFGCTECVQHFKAMAARNRIFDVKENDKAVLWLWISHNEVNLRLAGDATEDPAHPKIQFPSVSRCRECRLARGAWNLPAVYQYLESIYGMDNIRDKRKSRSTSAALSPFSNLDIGMLSLLYILSFIILVLVIKFFLSKRFYRKRHYKHGRGKV